MFSTNTEYRLGERRASLPTIVEAKSTRSVHLEMESVQDQPDYHHRTIDNFDDTSSFRSSAVEQRICDNADNEDFSRTFVESTPRHEDKHASLEEHDVRHHRPSTAEENNKSDFIRLTATPNPPEQLSVEGDYEPEQTLHGGGEAYPREQRHSYGPDHQARESIIHDLETPRASNTFDERFPQDSKANRILGLHKITLEALLREQEGLDVGTQRAFHSPDLAPKRLSHPPTLLPRNSVNLIPPPLNMARAQRERSPNFVRTPYPFMDQKQRPRSSPPAVSYRRDLEPSLKLTITLRRRSNVWRRDFQYLAIPGPSDPFRDFEYRPSVVRFASFGSPAKARDKNFDDRALFLALRARYALLTSRWRFLSARTVRYIEARFEPAKEVRTGKLAGRDAERYASTPFDGFAGVSASELVRLFHAPREGRGNYDWVRWARRMASIAQRRQRLERTYPDIVEKKGQKEFSTNKQAPDRQEGETTVAVLEFIEDWSMRRIMVAVVLVILLSLAAILVWVFFGKDWAQVGHKSPGERVVAAVILGVFVLLAGMVSIAAWLLASWIAL